MNQTAMEIVKPEESPITPMSVLQMAVSQGQDIDKLTKLMELQERWEANEARKAFNVSFSAFKSEAVRVVKNVTVSDGPLKGKRYADLFGVVDAVTPVLSKHNLSHSWKLTKDEPAWMEVTCTIRHSLGHFESVSMGAAPDTGPGRNAIQSRGSAKTYLERYTLLAAVGLAAANDDDDGKATGVSGSRLPDEVVGSSLDDIDACANLVELQRVYTRVCKMAQEADDKAAELQFIKRSNERKAAIRAGN